MITTDSYDFCYSALAGEICLTTNDAKSVSILPITYRMMIEDEHCSPPSLLPSPVFDRIQYAGPGDTEYDDRRILKLCIWQPHHANISLWKADAEILFLDAALGQPGWETWKDAMHWGDTIILTPPGGFTLAAYEAMVKADQGSRVLWINCGKHIGEWLDWYQENLPSFSVTVPGGWI